MPINIHRVKVAVLGDPGVGKTSTVQMFTSDGREFPKNYNMTFGVDLYLKRHTIPEKNIIEMLIYDCAGLDIYADCLQQCWDRVDAALFVCDVTAPPTMKSVADWARLVGPAGQSPPPRAMLANKTDLGHRRVVPAETAQQLAEKLGMQYFEGSAKEHSGVVEAFDWLAQQLHQESSASGAAVRPSYSTVHKSVLRSSLSNSSLK